MLEVGNGGMTTAEYRTHFTMWAAIKSPLIMGNKLYELSATDYAILTNPAILALSQDPNSGSIGRKFREEVDSRDQWGWGEIQVWSGSLSHGDQVVVFLNVANSTQTFDVPLWKIFGRPGNSNSLKDWDMYDLWGENVTIPVDVGAQILNGTIELSSTTQGYYNASDLGWAEGLAQNDTRLMGAFEGTVSAGGTVSAEVASHDVKAWRFRPAGSSSTRKDEL
jgi:alpha-galactosidase